LRRRFVVVALIAGLVIVGALLLTTLRDPRMPRDRAERALEAQLQDGRRYSCRQQEDDGSLGYDIDYVCDPVGVQNGRSYWIATNDDRITSVEPSG
jgi:hypothetical protein